MHTDGLGVTLGLIVTPAAEASADGSTTIYFAPTQLQGVPRGTKAGSQSYASTARWNRSLRKSGGRARSKRSRPQPDGDDVSLVAND
jgi:hypothetical protein